MAKRRTRTEFRKRVEAVYRAKLDKPSGYGALAWFAGIAEVDRRVVSRWVAPGVKRKPPGWAWALLAQLEQNTILEEANRD